MSSAFRALPLLAALVATASAPAVLAHNDAGQFRAVEWQCFGMPHVLRKNATNQQYFLFSNTGQEDVQFFIGAADYLGELAGNLVASVTSGAIQKGKTVSITNTQLQRTNVPVADEEGAYVCFAVDGWLGLGGPFKPLGAVSTRELRKVSGQWVSFDLHAVRNTWLVTERQSTSSSVEALTEQIHQLGPAPSQ